MASLLVELPPADKLTREQITQWGTELIRLLVEAVADLNENGTGWTPPVGTSGQVLKYDGNGNLVAGADTNTTYPTLTAAQAQTGTATTPSVITAQVLAGEIDRRIAAAG